jgi:parallel beta-helix repeat protein
MSNCSIYNNWRGIWLGNSNKVVNCNCYNNYGIGMKIERYCSNNTIVNCNFYNNDWGILVMGSSNIIYHNKFINNDQNAEDWGTNRWDNGYPSGGNYWDDYKGRDWNDDGIGDKPYDIPDNQDRYPLIDPIHIRKPRGWLYIFDKEIIPILGRNSIIIGKITIATRVAGFEKVEFYIDGNLKNMDTSEPYEWLWDENAFFRHTIKVVAYDIAGNADSDEQVVWIFNL